MVAHIAAGGSVVTQLFGKTLPLWASTLLYVAVFSPVVYFGTLWVDRLNLILIAGVVITYLGFVSTSISHINPSLLARMDWSAIWWALPIVFTAFGYQSLIPTLFNYMNRDVKKVRLAIVIGTLIPLVIYVIWQLLIIGIVPFQGTGGLAAALKEGQNAVVPLGNYIHSSTLLNLGQAFAFFAMTTSYLGISIAFVDFLADGLKLKKKGMKKLGICSLIFLIPMLITFYDPHLFLTALGIAGGYGVALLLGAMPILMVWAGRYYEGHSLMHQQLPGGKITLACLLGFIILELVISIAA
jgi:tyrosine-specific transport protein